MPKIHQHDDNRVDAEFDEVYNKIDLYKIQTTTPTNPRSGMMWFNPSDGSFKIFKNTQLGWQTI